MKIVHCKDCNADECVPVSMPEPWICSKCQALHKENEARDFELESELSKEEC